MPTKMIKLQDDIEIKIEDIQNKSISNAKNATQKKSNCSKENKHRKIVSLSKFS